VAAGGGRHGLTLPPGLLVGLVLGAIALLHLGLGLVLTRGARHDVASLEAAWSPQALADATDPGPAPATTGPEYSAWLRGQRLHEDAQRHRERSAQVRMLTIGLSLSWVIQSAVVAWIGFKRRSAAR
jgi:hypothetical protein